MTADPEPTVPVPPLLPGQPPIAILVDFDGTIATVDVADEIMLHFEPGAFELDDTSYVTGQIGSRYWAAREVARLPHDPAPILAFAAEQPLHDSFGPFVRKARGLEIPIEVVSDGFGFYVGPALERLGVPEIPVITSRTIFDGGAPRMEFPNGHPECLVCGTCKRRRVLAHQAAGRAVVFIGDGESDRYAAVYADRIFAKRRLIDFCEAGGLAYTRWHDFTELDAWLDETMAAWRADPTSLPGPVARPFVCGPEVWGPGRVGPAAR